MIPLPYAYTIIEGEEIPVTPLEYSRIKYLYAYCLVWDGASELPYEETIPLDEIYVKVGG